VRSMQTATLYAVHLPTRIATCYYDANVLAQLPASARVKQAVANVDVEDEQ
jgi:hypothetical protein